MKPPECWITPPEWPLAIDELEGELLFEVDRFTESRDAYERAAKRGARRTPGSASPAPRTAWRTVTACRAYTTASRTPGLPSSVELEISLYALKCKV